MSDARETTGPTGPTEPIGPTEPSGPTEPVAGGTTPFFESIGATPGTGDTAVLPDDTAVFPRDAATEVIPPSPPAWLQAPPAPEPPAPAAPVSSAALSAATPRPTVRWGALVWALIFGSVAGLTLWILVDPARRDAADAWLADLNPFAAGLSALIVIGVVVALFGVVGLIRRGERVRADARRS